MVAVVVSASALKSVKKQSWDGLMRRRHGAHIELGLFGTVSHTARTVRLQVTPGHAMTTLHILYPVSFVGFRESGFCKVLEHSVFMHGLGPTEVRLDNGIIPLTKHSCPTWWECSEDPVRGCSDRLNKPRGACNSQVRHTHLCSELAGVP